MSLIVKTHHTAAALFAVLAALLLPAAAASAVPAIPKLSGASTNGNASDSTRGWQFDVTAPGGITLTHLGVLDVGGDGLADAHPVGVWPTAGVGGPPLFWDTVPAGTAAPLDSTGRFRLVDVPDFHLDEGTRYTIGALYLDGSADLQLFWPTTFATDPGITFVRERFTHNDGVTTLAKPDNSNGLSPGLFGPGFEILPEPTGAAAAAAMLALRSFGTRSRRRDR